jgi:hypothetical protein
MWGALKNAALAERTRGRAQLEGGHPGPFLSQMADYWRLRYEGCYRPNLKAGQRGVRS